MSIQSLFLLNDSGEVLFEKHERGRATDRKICDWYWTEVGKRKDLGQVRRSSVSCPTSICTPQVSGPQYEPFTIIVEHCIFVCRSRKSLLFTIFMVVISRLFTPAQLSPLPLDFFNSTAGTTSLSLSAVLCRSHHPRWDHFSGLHPGGDFTTALHGGTLHYPP
jgi:hypothetical protein